VSVTGAAIPKFRLTSLTDDVRCLRQTPCLAERAHRHVMVRHSYGGQVMIAPWADAPDVVGLVYMAAFGLDEGESINAVGARRMGPRRSRWPPATSR
jgi:pimeloyl-ACP methyl ester carboxylesterase